MLKKSVIFLILLCKINEVESSYKKRPPYDMKCNCGIRKVDENIEKACVESAMLESELKGKIMILTISFPNDHNIRLFITFI